ncbi:hypothetical protein COU56_00275 [Candidatus Pacearchaeota archaeon CG10_big_fil_rev_8_21_14_0_10_31_9]|nr:MAG: hypothetical protein AUJ62_00660 [Candidatus Pacearchaeota archaeon CG1_02_32_21]PIN96279.1 MAG: hypothetical protein COU56_00275 [Candidatus Pacearchaeota archaeon CG10_big_fil_rev_8_21_14_0_10_31_9]PIZ82581.1 MAG: hypothetical protein COX97_04100 [Candidatus Pacearchaeota archaeon CG_4_10_14_0_2_um_filter_05_32_18]
MTRKVSEVKTMKQWDRLVRTRQKHPGKSDKQIDGIESRRSFLFKLGMGALALTPVVAYISNHYQRQKEQIYREMGMIDVRVKELQRSIGRKTKIEELENILSDLRLSNEQFKEYIDTYDERLMEELAKLNAKRDEEMEIYQFVIDGFYDYEKRNPEKYVLGEGSRVLDLARTIFPESRGEWESEKYQRYVGTTVIERAHLTGTDFPEVISKKGAYEFMDPENPMYKIFLNPLRDREEEAWFTTFDRSRTLIGLPYEELNPKVTHYFARPIKNMNTNLPSWADKGKLVDEITINGKITRFRNIPEDF